MRNSGMLKNIAVLASSAALGRVIAFAVMPLLTRLYTPEQFGVFAIFSALIAITVPLASLRYCVAIPLPTVRTVAASLVVICLLSAFLISSLLAILTFLFAGSINKPAVLLPVSDYLWAVPIATLGGAIFEILQFWALRSRHVVALARAQIVQSFLSSAVKIILGLYLQNPLGLILGHIFQVAGGGLGLLRTACSDLRSVLSRITLKRLIVVLSHYRDYPLYRLPSQFLLIVASQYPVLMVATLFGSEDAGQFSLAFNSLAVPIGIVSHSVGNAFFVELTSIENKDRSKIRDVSLALIVRLALLSAIPALMLVLFGGGFFQIVFGYEWSVAGKFAESLAIALFAQIVFVPIVHVLTVLDRNRDLLWINFVRLVLILLVAGGAILLSLDSQQSIFLYSLVMFGHYLFVGLRVGLLLSRAR